MKIDIQVEDVPLGGISTKGFLEDVVITVANKEYVFSFITNERLQHELRMTWRLINPGTQTLFELHCGRRDFSKRREQAVQVVMSCDPRVLQYYARDSQSPSVTLPVLDNEELLQQLKRSDMSCLYCLVSAHEHSLAKRP